MIPLCMLQELSGLLLEFTSFLPDTGFCPLSRLFALAPPLTVISGMYCTPSNLFKTA